MKFSKVHSPIDDFDQKLLDDPDFKEDSVREEIIVPILKELEYSAGGPNRIIRSKALQHPFVSIGSKRKNISIVPDYLFEVGGSYAWVLEAKGPNEKIIQSKHVEQAYSYAIHNEVRVPYFALCNGREFVLYNVSKVEPVIHIKIEEFGHAWPALINLIAPENVKKQEFKLAKDLGLHIIRLGLSDSHSHIFPDIPVPFIAKLDSNKYRISVAFKFDERNSYMASFDFDSAILKNAKGKLPQEAIDSLLEPIEPGQRKKVVFADGSYHVSLKCKLGLDMEETDDEIYLPLTVEDFL